MIYSDVVNAGLILPWKKKYTIVDVRRVMQHSLFKPVCGRTFNPHEASFIVKCSALYHDTDYSASVARAGTTVVFERT